MAFFIDKEFDLRPREMRIIPSEICAIADDLDK